MQQAQLDLLVLAMQSGDKRAFSLLYRHFHRDLRRFAAYLLSNPAAAEDLVQNVWLKVSQRIVRLQDPAVFSCWLYRAVRWEVLDYQKLANQRLTEPLLAQHEPWTNCESLPDNTLSCAISGLPADVRDVVQLYYLHELALQQIALILDIPEGTVKSRLHRARSLLQQTLTEES
ncbi:RNA polymerase sigma factor [Rheinheimera maricola]|uniref:RNA polymerase sigma factor n=1 Tax=Rheinheimera maricola TaxID=2793282 RepID=A0ABS7XCK2_9GAMM|nr:RNA polymerase sigma factor [Rheinheimera maricola]MBZ9613286.1 RNA polymerase sigma factor [Rheinheimera maricola]